MNTVNITARLGQDPELRHTPTGLAVCALNLAVSDGWGDSQKTIWLDCTVFKGAAENCAKFLRKGSQVAITGRLNQDEWTDKATGKKRTKINLVASSVDFLGSNQDAAAPRQQEHPSAATAGARAQDQDEDEDDIPF